MVDSLTEVDEAAELNNIEVVIKIDSLEEDEDNPVEVEMNVETIADEVRNCVIAFETDGEIIVVESLTLVVVVESIEDVDIIVVDCIILVGVTVVVDEAIVEVARNCVIEIVADGEIIVVESLTLVVAVEISGIGVLNVRIIIVDETAFVEVFKAGEIIIIAALVEVEVSDVDVVKSIVDTDIIVVDWLSLVDDTVFADASFVDIVETIWSGSVGFNFEVVVSVVPIIGMVLNWKGSVNIVEIFNLLLQEFVFSIIFWEKVLVFIPVLLSVRLNLGAILLNNNVIVVLKLIRFKLVVKL